MKWDFPAPTARLYLVVLAFTLPVGLGVIAPLFLGAAAAGAVAILATLLVDYAAAPAPADFQVERKHDPRLYLAHDNVVQLAVFNRSRRPAEVRLRDTPPTAFISSTLFAGGAVPAGGEVTFSYTTRPTARGRYRFGGIVLRWRTPLGLLWREKHLGKSEEVPVYPNLREVERYDLLTRRGLQREAGLRNARRLGRGTAFESLRDYQPDDDFRWIDWKATARRHRPITTLYETERNQRLVVMLDLGRMMQTRVGDLTRLDHAVNAALLLAYVALARGDRVGLLSFAEQIQAYAPPRSGRAHFYQIVEQLYAVRAQPIESDYSGAFTRLRHDLHGRSLIALFTDLTDPEGARTVARQLAGLARQHVPLCIALSDPVLEERAHRTPENSRQLYERVVAGLRLEEREALLDGLRHAGVSTVDVPADRLTIAAINRYLEIKERAML